MEQGGAMPQAKPTIVPLGEGRYALITPSSSASVSTDDFEEDGFEIFTEGELRLTLKHRYALADHEVSEKLEAAADPGPIKTAIAYSEGQEAREAGLPITSCTHIPGSAAHFRWIRGWLSSNLRRPV
jgi:hypothetical protein